MSCLLHARPAVLVFSALASALVCLAQESEPSGGASAFSEDFERDLSAWQIGAEGKTPVLLTDKRAFAGKQCAYSGPPGSMRVARHDFDVPLSGRIEMRFYDDMAPVKHQIGSPVGGPEQILGIICHGGTHYEYRIGTTYTKTAVKRTEGWHLFAWECDGRKTTAFIDGTPIAENPDLARIHAVIMGSFWDASTGWYDDVRAWSCQPEHAGSFAQAEHLFRQTGIGNRGIRTSSMPGASGSAVTEWKQAGHSLEWSLHSTAPGDTALLLRYSAPEGDAVRRITYDTGEATHTFPATPADNWAFTLVPIGRAESARVLAMEAVTGDLSLDWLAIVPRASDARSYGELVTKWLTEARPHTSAWDMTARRAASAGLRIDDLRRSPDTIEWFPDETTLRGWMDNGREGLHRARERVVAADSARLDTVFRVSEWRLPEAETELSRKYYRRLLRYVRLTHPRFRDWSLALHCRYHKREGSREWDVRQNATVALGYGVLLRGSYDAEIAGVPLDRIRDDLIALLRTIAITHKANFLPTSDGKAWGDQWQSAFWAGIAGQAAWLVWDQLPDDVRLMVACMAEHEANRFNTRRPDSGVKYDTKAEENAWNSEVIALAACMFPGHPNHELWIERAIVYMLNSFPREQDLKSQRIIDGKPVAERLSAITLHPDFTLENHHRVHPDYMSTGSLMLRNALLYGAAGLAFPQSMSFNVPETYDVLKGLISTNGSCFYVNGQDWWPHRHDVPILLSGFMSVLQGDAQAAYIERATLDFTARMHARFDEGSMWDTREYNYANAEEEMIARYSELYLLHRALGDGATPVTREDFLAATSGVRVYEIGGFVTHRTPAKFASFAWNNSVMGLVFPSDDTWFTAPSERGMVGTISCAGLKDDQPRVLERRLTQFDGGFALGLSLQRCEGAVEQRLAFVSLPDAPVVYLERLIARRDVDVRSVRTASIGILNEDAPGICENRRQLFLPGRIETVHGATREPDRTIPLDTPWINIDAKLGVLGSSGAMAYHDRNRYHRSRLEDTFSANALDAIGLVSAETVFSASTTTLVPNQSPDETAEFAVASRIDAAGLLTARLPDGTTVLANLSDAPLPSPVGDRPAIPPLSAVFVPQ